MNADTGELQALRAQVEEYREHERLLILTIERLTDGRPDPQASRRARPRLRFIRGGRP